MIYSKYFQINPAAVFLLLINTPLIFDGDVLVSFDAKII